MLLAKIEASNLLYGGVYKSDTGPFERLYNAWVIDTLPEIVAEQSNPF